MVWFLIGTDTKLSHSNVDIHLNLMLGKVYAGFGFDYTISNLLMNNTGIHWQVDSLPYKVEQYLHAQTRLWQKAHWVIWAGHCHCQLNNRTKNDWVSTILEDSKYLDLSA